MRSPVNRCRFAHCLCPPDTIPDKYRSPFFAIAFYSTAHAAPHSDRQMHTWTWNMHTGRAGADQRAGVIISFESFLIWNVVVSHHLRDTADSVFIDRHYVGSVSLVHHEADRPRATCASGRLRSDIHSFVEHHFRLL